MYNAQKIGLFLVLFSHSGSRNRTRIDGFGDRFPTIRRFPYIYEYKEPVARFLRGAVRTLKTAYTCCRLDGGLATAFLLSLRKRVIRRSIRSRLHDFALNTFFQTEVGHSSLATLTIS